MAAPCGSAANRTLPGPNARTPRAAGVAPASAPVTTARAAGVPESEAAMPAVSSRAPSERTRMQSSLGEPAGPERPGARSQVLPRLCAWCLPPGRETTPESSGTTPESSGARSDSEKLQSRCEETPEFTKDSRGSRRDSGVIAMDSGVVPKRLRSRQGIVRGCGRGGSRPSGASGPTASRRAGRRIRRSRGSMKKVPPRSTR